MKQIWARLAARIDARNIRERGLLFAVLVIIVVALANGLVFQRFVAQERRLGRQIQEDRKAVQTIQTEIEKMVTTIHVDPEADSRTKLEKLKAEADAAEEAVRHLQKGLVSPDQISQVLEGILDRQGKLKMVSLKKLPLQSFAAPSGPGEGGAGAASAKTQAASAGTTNAPMSSTAPAPGDPKGAIYKHGVQIVVQGQYFDILDYLVALERLPQQVFWGEARFQVDQYPKATLTLELFTLSLEKKWLNL